MQDADESKLLVLAAHCPSVLQRRTWSVQQFTLEKLLYVGHNSRVLRAIDKVTGTTVALKVYKKQQLGDMERCAPLPPRLACFPWQLDQGMWPIIKDAALFKQPAEAQALGLQLR